MRCHGQDSMTSSMTLNQIPQKPCSGTAPDIWISWQGKLYGPYRNEKEARADGFILGGWFILDVWKDNG